MKCDLVFVADDSLTIFDHYYDTLLLQLFAKSLAGRPQQEQNQRSRTISPTMANLTKSPSLL